MQSPGQNAAAPTPSLTAMCALILTLFCNCKLMSWTSWRLLLAGITTCTRRKAKVIPNPVTSLLSSFPSYWHQGLCILIPAMAYNLPIQQALWVW